MKFIAKRIGDGAEIEGYVLRCDGNINQGMTYICPEVRQGNIVGLKGSLAEMSFGPFYAVDPESVTEAAPRDKIEVELEKIHKIAEELGAEVDVSMDDFIDDDHLDCIWYGGYIGSISYKGFEIRIGVYGDVRVYGRGDYPEWLKDLEYVNKNNDGAWSHNADDSLRTAFASDKELYTAMDREDITFENNNWIEAFVVCPDGNYWRDTDICSTENVLKAFSEIREWVDWLESVVIPDYEEEKSV